MSPGSPCRPMPSVREDREKYEEGRCATESCRPSNLAPTHPEEQSHIRKRDCDEHQRDSMPGFVAESELLLQFGADKCPHPLASHPSVPDRIDHGPGQADETDDQRQHSESE